MVQRSREKEQKQQHINGTENILLKSCTTARVRNYDQKSSGRPDSSAAWNSLCSRRFLACYVTRTRIMSPAVHTCRGRVVWNMSFLVTSMI
ncbi:hypothetical protein TNCV_1855991 [Trichonephila clavipes]|nr:hypothetical protein TNCV_1855991 [Trichonephila clavipes]